MKKYDLYEEMIRRLDVAVQNGHFFEASWYAYAVLEDRLNSMLNSGGFGSPIRMMGPKIKKLDELAETNEVLRANFEKTRLNNWKDARNDLMHAMAEGLMSIDAIDHSVEELAQEGSELVRIYSAAARRQKRHAARTR